MTFFFNLTSKHHFFWFLLILGLLTFSGCSDKRRQSINGSVNFDGQPMKEGSIRFIPLKGTSGPTAGAPIIDGKFTIDESKGTFAGRFRVEIVAKRPTGKTTYNPVTEEEAQIREPYVPARYNAESELVANIKAGEPNHLEYNLTSK